MLFPQRRWRPLVSSEMLHLPSSWSNGFDVLCAVSQFLDPVQHAEITQLEKGLRDFTVECSNVSNKIFGSSIVFWMKVTFQLVTALRFIEHFPHTGDSFTMSNHLWISINQNEFIDATNESSWSVLWVILHHNHFRSRATGEDFQITAKQVVDEGNVNLATLSSYAELDHRLLVLFHTLLTRDTQREAPNCDEGTGATSNQNGDFKAESNLGAKGRTEANESS